MARVLGEFDSRNPLVIACDDREIRTAFEDGAWGLSTAYDIHNCDAQMIRDPLAVKQCIEELCAEIDMVRFGDCIVVNFGRDPRVAGLSAMQLIETSNITAHFANDTGAVYPDIFSCKYYNPFKAGWFLTRFFKGSDFSLSITERK